VTREEARKLLSGYATGSLTESEQRLLFDAALDDQDLFDELAEEQVVKGLIELPGARQRLLAALDPPVRQRAWWAQPWPWTVAAAVSVIAVAIWMIPRTETAPVEIAQSVEAPAVAPKREVAPPPPAPRSTQQVDAVTALANKTVVQDAATKGAVAAARGALEERTDTLTVTETSPLPASLEAQAKNSLPVLTIGQPAPTAPAAAFLARDKQATIAGGDALSYEVTAGGVLRIVPVRTGVLEVTAGEQTLFRSNPVVANTPIELSIPTDAQELRIDFAATANAPGVTAIQSQTASGTLVLPAGANPRVAITIPAKP